MGPNVCTPVQKYEVNGIPVYVKREDLCTPAPGPPFSKMRGLYTHMKMLKIRGCKVVGYTESAISMAGWGVAWVANQLGMKAVIFDPIYKHKTPELLLLHRKKWKELGAETIPIQAGRTKVNNYIATERFYNQYNDGVMLPIGLRLSETVDETANEWKRTLGQLISMGVSINTVVVCVGSGTICAGLVKGIEDEGIELIGVMAYGTSYHTKKRQIMEKSGLSYGLFAVAEYDLCIKMSNYRYTEECDCDCPFPCHPYYDLKAWKWLVKHLPYTRIEKPVLFWNIGSQPKE